MKPKRLRIPHLAIGAIMAGALYSGANPPSQFTFTQGSGNTWNADWNSPYPNRTFFAQGSVDLENWLYLPVIEFGTGLKGAGIDSGGAPKYFFRLISSDYEWVTNLQEARDADFDGDGIPNWFEINILGTDPLDKDSNGGDSNSNGISDGYEMYHFGALGVYGLNDDPDNDGLINQIEVLLGMNAVAGHIETTSDNWEIHLPN